MSDDKLDNRTQKDKEAHAYKQAFEYLNGVDEYAQMRLIHTLCHKYFPKGVFDPGHIDLKEVPFEHEKFMKDICEGK